MMSLFLFSPSALFPCKSKLFTVLETYSKHFFALLNQ